jgi:sugar phosphate isomerase/epimerase
MLPHPFPLSGLADEAADDIDGQISAHKALHWSCLELRLLHGRQFSSAAVSDDDFRCAVDKIESAGMHVSSYASAIGNWSRPIAGDFQIDLSDLRVLIPRMQRTRTRFVRTMGWVRGEASDESWRDECVRRYKEMAKMAADGGILLLHENCEGWGGLSGDHARQFIERVNHPNVRYLFDIGNTASYGQPTMPFYKEVLPFVEYVHIKDCRRNPAGGKSSAFTYAGEGDAHVREILIDLIRRGYKAGVSIEPHVASIVHLGEGTKASPQERFDSYIRYGQGLEKLLAEIQAEPLRSP